MTKKEKPSKRPTIAELEAILNRDEEVEIVIMPNGEVREKAPNKGKAGLKPLTYRENLGGEYGKAA